MQEIKPTQKEALAARNRRLGLSLFSVALVFFIGIVIKRSVLG